MTVATEAVSHAVQSALLADGALAALLNGAGKIYRGTPPLKATFPYVTVPDIQPSDDFGGGAEEHQITLHAWSRQGGHREAHLIAGAILQALDDTPLLIEGRQTVGCQFNVADVRREADGKTYHALIRLRVITEDSND